MPVYLQQQYLCCKSMYLSKINDIPSNITNDRFSLISVLIKTFNKIRHLEDLLTVHIDKEAKRCCFSACVIPFIFYMAEAVLQRILKQCQRRQWRRNLGGKSLHILIFLNVLLAAVCWILHLCSCVPPSHCSVQTNRFQESRPCVLAVKLLTGQRTNQITVVFNW